MRRLSPAPVVRAHPLLLLPPLGAVLATAGNLPLTAVRLAFIVAGGTAVAVELAARAVSRSAWARHRWPPAEHEPVALLSVAAGALWVAAWAVLHQSMGGDTARAMETGVRAGIAAVGIQFAGWLLAARARPPPVAGRFDHDTPHEEDRWRSSSPWESTR